MCAGRTWQDKVSDVRAKMKEAQASVVVVAALDEVACMLVYHSHTTVHFLPPSLSLSPSLPLPPSPLSLSSPPSLSQGCSIYEGQILTTTQCFLPMPLSPWKMSGKHCCSLALITVAHPGPALAHPRPTLSLLHPGCTLTALSSLLMFVSTSVSVTREECVSSHTNQCLLTYLSLRERGGCGWVDRLVTPSAALFPCQIGRMHYPHCNYWRL